jgi:hypothetical protein
VPARPTYASFLVRLWREAEPDPQEIAAGWQGEVQHIQTSQRRAFSTLDELLGLMRQVTEEADAPSSIANK